MGNILKYVNTVAMFRDFNDTCQQHTFVHMIYM